jgi:hypothetical protein
MENDSNKFETIHIDQIINTDIKKVFDTLIAEDTYGKWTAAFGPGCHFKGSWEEGSKMQFLAPNKIGEINGMFSTVKENKSPHKLTLEHQGIVQNGEETKEGNEAEKWSGAKESYTLKEEDGKTHLSIVMDLPEEEKGFFIEAWEQALVSLKEICEEKQ